jgi:hypothetical protein
MRRFFALAAGVPLLALILGVAASANAQVRAEAADPAAPPPSRWAADLERIDEDLRLRLLTPSDPGGNWIRASLDKTDIASQVSHFTAARTQAPQQKLYMASLATACMQPTLPVLPECDAMDRLADWARRDTDNGVPDILLADRARRRGEADKVVAHLEEAAGKPRYDEYWGQGVLAFWDYLRPLPLSYDPAAKAVAALNYGTEQPVAWPTSMQLLCANPRERGSDALRAACARVGEALSERSTSWLGRLLGIAIAHRNAQDGARQKQLEGSRVASNQQRARCDDARRVRFEGLESADPALRMRAIAAGDAWLHAQAQYGEVEACSRLLNAR